MAELGGGGGGKWERETKTYTIHNHHRFTEKILYVASQHFRTRRTIQLCQQDANNKKDNDDEEEQEYVLMSFPFSRRLELLLMAKKAKYYSQSLGPPPAKCNSVEKG